MSEVGEKVVSVVVQHIDAIFRYFASGFVALFVFQMFYGQRAAEIVRLLDKDALVVLIIVAATTGMLLYAVHASVIMRLFFWPPIVWTHMRLASAKLEKHEKTMPSDPSQDTEDTVQKKRCEWRATCVIDIEAAKIAMELFDQGDRSLIWAMRTLDMQRWKRRSSELREVAIMQKEMDSWAAQIKFLYCSAYPLILIPASTFFCEPHQSHHASLALIVGCFLLVAAMISDWKLTAREILCWKS